MPYVVGPLCSLIGRTRTRVRESLSVTENRLSAEE